MANGNGRGCLSGCALALVCMILLPIAAAPVLTILAIALPNMVRAGAGVGRFSLLGLPAILFVGTGILGFILLKKLFHNKDNGNGTSEETELIRDIHSGLERMEERIDSLETILKDEDNKQDGSQGNSRT
ncbi:hypothetical protein ACFL1X_14265 [Candidatus Hydrogenedentota bacterium]